MSLNYTFSLAIPPPFAMIMKKLFNEWELIMSETISIYPKSQHFYRGEHRVPMPPQFTYEGNYPLTLAHKKRIADIENQLDLASSGAPLPLHIHHNADLSPRTSYYTLSIDDSQILIEAVGDESLYYALTTLYHIVDQSRDTLPHLRIEDYATSQFRGLVEGYYGIPYSLENRESLMEFGSFFKMNTYVYAPKDDPYHRDLWWEEYPSGNLTDLSRQAQFGEEHGLHFVYTLSPFKPDSNPITPENRDLGLAQIIDKFEQLHAAGIRQFGIQGDDVGQLPYDTVIYVLNALNTWRKSKGDIADLFYCPQGYTLAEWSFGDGTEANLMDQGLDPDIHIFYTGITTCNVLDRNAIHGWKTLHLPSGQSPRRSPLFWMNWPVNDIDRTTHRRLFLGKGEVYEQGCDGFVGVLTNPMEEAEASKIALFATLDFGWNSPAFDDDTSWAASFPYIEPAVPEALHEIAKHMSGISNGAKEDAEESVELKAICDCLGSSPDPVVLENLKAYFAKIVDACKTFMEKADNTLLHQEMRPYVNTLALKAEAGKLYTEALLDTDSDDAMVLLKEQANRLLIQMKENTVTTRTAEFPTSVLFADAGREVIDRCLEKLRGM